MKNKIIRGIATISFLVLLISVSAIDSDTSFFYITTIISLIFIIWIGLANNWYKDF